MASATYLIDNQILVDCGSWHDEFFNVSSMLLTHCHFDHIYGLNFLAERNPNVIIYTNEAGKEMLRNTRKNMSFYHESPFELSCAAKVVIVDNGESVNLTNNLSAKAVFTPGHNPSCITWQIGDAVFTGDSYIPGIKTVTNLPGGDKELARQSELLIKSLADDKIIYPGHKI